MKWVNGGLLGKQRLWCDMKQSRRFLKCLDDVGNQYGHMVDCTCKPRSSWECGNWGLLPLQQAWNIRAQDTERREWDKKQGHGPELQQKTLFRYPLWRILFFEEKSGPDELVDIQELPSSSSRNFHPCVLEFRQRQQLACMAEEDDLHKNQTQKGRCGNKGRKE